ncbi:RNA polymerase II holoenzyme cyclin-like subunit [Neolecta irregularis DAH-3]|uniref:RNA polymerase II holoenzyme cyclin-like subunit n=1 Tax=Neolecta irregularis (strain DAH-3) TaxID=1198029 RepID=A0A1U7LTJ9_NEOID|nr:RNA polymerase II holoenzyme cyclin-like subunit [Neolecta irregularis DAH-3]|eukprot:OLL25938.1 RNA polymerase II holoenzyme cyclin-like subunit [Neolecta irregularis DAH-3]
MAANYWTSSQRLKWQLTKTQLEHTRRADLLFCQEDDLRLVRIYLYSLIQRLGRRLQLRQQPMATAAVYMARFYTKVAIRETNPYLVCATCVYIASKMEECPQHIRTVVSEAKSLWQDYVTLDSSKLAECEFYVISEMSSYLIIHHPYRTLTQLNKPLDLSPEETQTSWAIINDSYMTDLPLLYPPHVIALTAIYLSIVLPNVQMSKSGITSTSLESRNNDKMISWFADNGVEMESIVNCTQEMISFYAIWETYIEKDLKDLVARMMAR